MYLVIIVSILSHARRLDRALVGVGVAMLAFSFSDGIFASTGYQRPNVIDVGYTVGYLLIGLTAAAGRSIGDVVPRRDLARWQVLLPYAPLLLDGALVISEIVRRGALDGLLAVSGG